MRSSRKVPLTVAAAASLTLFNPTAAFAAYFGTETDYAANYTPGDVDQHWTCSQAKGAYVCFTGLGDYIKVYDEAGDGYAAVAEWDDLDSTRSGSCVNKLSAGSAGTCNKNFTEGHTIRLRAALYDSGEPVGAKGAWVEGNA